MINSLRGQCAEFGVVAPQTRAGVAQLIELVQDPEDDRLPGLARTALGVLVERLETLRDRIAELDRELLQWHRASPVSQRLGAIPGIGPLTATALTASLGDGRQFRNGRQFAALLWLVPRQHGTGGKIRLGRISRRGDSYLRCNLVHGARSALAWRLRRDEPYQRDGMAAVARKRARWRALRRRLDPGRLVFVDETWIKTNMAPLRGWAPRGHRLKGYAPHGRWRTLTFLAGLRRDGLSAPCVFDGPINQRSFQAWVEQHLVPTLRPGDLVILDNLASHKGKAVRRAIRRAGARLWFLPPYSQDLNPIEQVFAKIKHWMRDAQKRTVDDVWQHLGALIATIEPRECQNYIRNAGYDST